MHAEEEYLQVLCSAKELYARPLAHNYPEFHDVIFQPLADLARVSAEFCQRVSQSDQITKRHVLNNLSSRAVTQFLHGEKNILIIYCQDTYPSLKNEILCLIFYFSNIDKKLDTT